MSLSFLEHILVALQSFNWLIAGGIFVAYIVVDGMYAYYTLSVTKRKPFPAAATGFMMHFILAFGILNYVHNFLYIIPLAIGSFIGTYCIVKREQVSILKETHE